MATQKIGDVVRKLFSKTTVSAERLNSIVEALNLTELEIEDEDVNVITSSLMNEKEAETQLSGKLKPALESKAKADIYGTLDKVLQRFEHLLEGESKATYEAAKNTYGKFETMLNYLQERSHGGKDSEAFKREYNKLKDSIERDYVPKSKFDEVNNELNPALEDRFYSKLLQKAHAHKGISSEEKEKRRFDDNFIADFKETLQAKGYKVDFKTGKLLDKDGNPALNGVDEVNPYALIDDLVQAIPEYQKKSEGKPASGKIDVDVPKGIEGFSAAQAKNMERLANMA